ncbi:MAG TPA: proline dehydrogenase family protein [Acidimicrobiia bacterium]
MPGRLGKALMIVTERPIVRKMFTETRPGRALAARFVAGESLDEAITVAKRLNAEGFSVSLDHLGEHVEDAAAVAAARDDYLAALDEIGDSGLDANVSVKLTQLGLGLSDGLVAESLAALARRAQAVGTTVTVDMEESAYTAATIDLYSAAQADHGNLGVAVQAYLRRTASDLERIIPLGGHIRLCKGAYLEAEGVAFQQQEEVDESYDRLLTVLMAAESVRPAIASHDDDRIAHARRLAERRPGNYEFQMLYGVRGPLQRDLVARGYPVRVYVPYGVAWYPYLTRRLAERPGNLRFFLRAAAGRR